MIKLIKKNILLFFLPILSLGIACNSVENIGSVSSVKISKDINFRKGFTVQLKIGNLANPGFNSKAFANPVAPKGLSDVKSFSAFLTTNFNDPFAVGANPQGNGVLTDVNYGGNGSVTITFSSVTSGGPYYAVIAAFDNFVGSSPRNNITNPSPTITSTDKAWARSSNGITIQPDGTFVYTDGSNDLKADLTFKDGSPNSADLQIVVTDGNTVPATSVN